MFLVVIPQCSSMEMNYLSAVWLQMCGGNQFKTAEREVSFAFLPTIYFGVLSQIFNIGSLFTLVFQSCNTINIVRANYKRAAVRLTASHLLQSYQKVWIPAVSIRCSASTIYETD